MPLPDGFLQSIAADFDPALSRPEYDANQPLWRLYLDLYELDANKLKDLVEKHHDNEDDDKFARRQALAAVYNLIPMVVNMIVGYVFNESPIIDVSNDPQLKRFVENCDGAGTGLGDYVKKTALPMALTLGFVDVLVENPSVPPAQVLSQADVQSAGVVPHVVTITPLQRTNWSAQPNHQYNWLRFHDAGNEDEDPFIATPARAEAFVTYAQAGQGIPTAYWIRSVRQGSEGGQKASWEHTGDVAPTRRLPVATLYYKRSNDPVRRHFGLSKIAMMAVLTKGIIQILSWSYEDILANLALYCMPSKGGQKPVTEDGRDAIQELQAFTILWFDREAGSPPMVLQGDVSHIEVKFKLIEMHLREILRLANLLAASGGDGGEGGTGGKATSGRQAEIERTELFKELTDISADLDTFVMELLALAASWAANKDISADELRQRGVKVDHYKGPWTMDDLASVIQNAQACIDMFARVSPTTVEGAYSQVARQFLYASGDQLDEALSEIRSNTGKVLADQLANEDLLTQAQVASAGADNAAATSEEE